MFDVITCGSGTVDVFAESESELITLRTSQHTENLIAFPVGEKLLVKKLNFSVGGGGTNTAVAFARQKYKTGWVGCLGDGTNGDLIKKTLKKEQVTFVGHITKRFESGYSFIMNALNHDRTILVHKGANNDLTFSKLSLPKLRAKCFYFSSMVGKSYASQKKLAAYAKKQGALVVFNPSSYQAGEGLTKLTPMLNATDILVFNKEESEILCETRDRTEIFAKLHSFGISSIIITDGPSPFFASNEGVMYKITNSNIRPLESTGAGDAFASGFVGMYLKTGKFEQSLKSGVVNAQSVITHCGAKEKLLSLTQIKRGISSSKIRIKQL